MRDNPSFACGAHILIFMPVICLSLVDSEVNLFADDKFMFERLPDSNVRTIKQIIFHFDKSEPNGMQRRQAVMFFKTASCIRS